ncbi:MAG: choline ABC transporter permease, partial [Gemmatimonadota bacterium]
MGDLLRYLRDHAGQVSELTFEHVTMVAIAVGVAVAVGVPPGIAATRWRRWERLVMGTANLLQTIPSLAL